MLAKAGLDPENPPATYDDFRATARAMTGNSLWISKESKHQEAASALISLYAGKDAQTRLLSGMNSPAICPDLVDQAEVHPAFKLKDALSAERDRAIAAAAKEGSTATLDDWAFPNWTRGNDYAVEDYQ